MLVSKAGTPVQSMGRTPTFKLGFTKASILFLFSTSKVYFHRGDFLILIRVRCYLMGSSCDQQKVNVLPLAGWFSDEFSKKNKALSIVDSGCYSGFGYCRYMASFCGRKRTTGQAAGGACIHFRSWG